MLSKRAPLALRGSFDGNHVNTSTFPSVSNVILMSLFGESAAGFLLSTNLLIVSPQIVLQRGHVPCLVLPLLVSQQPRTRSLPSNPKAP